MIASFRSVALLAKALANEPTAHRLLHKTFGSRPSVLFYPRVYWGVFLVRAIGHRTKRQVSMVGSFELSPKFSFGLALLFFNSAAST
jgi:hypothetical protein